MTVRGREFGVVAVVVAVAALGLGAKIAQGEQSSLDVALDALTGGVMIGCAQLLRARNLQPGLGRLLLVGAGFWFAEDLIISTHTSLYVAGLVFEDAFDPVLVHMLLAYPTGHLRSPFERRLVGIAYAGALGGGAARAVLTYAGPHPCAAACNIAWHPSALYNAVRPVQDAIAGSITIAAVVILVGRHLAATPAARRRMQAFTGAILLIAIVYGVSLIRNVTPAWPGPVYTMMSGALTVSALMFPVCVVLGVIRADALRARVAELALSRPDATRAQDGLRRLLADAALEIVPVGGSPGAANGHTATPLAVDGTCVGMLAHDPVLTLDPGLLTIVASAAAMSLLHGRHEVDPGSLGAVARLSSREREVLELMADGLSNEVIAKRLGISFKTVEKHVANVFAKLDLPAEAHLNRRVAAVVSYMRAGL